VSGQGNFNRQFDHERVKELLDGGVRPIEVAKIVGCTRQRVSQLDLKYFGMTGRERARNRRIEASVVPPTHPFVTAAQERGYLVQSIPLPTLRPSKCRVLVNGFSCGLFTSCKRVIGKNTYWTIRRSTSNLDMDFCIWDTPVGFLIIPRKKQPKHSTCIALRDRRKPGAYSKRHDYINYLNAWEQLERKRENKIA
jgi:hypothetical protein